MSRKPRLMDKVAAMLRQGISPLKPLDGAWEYQVVSRGLPQKIAM